MVSGRRMWFSQKVSKLILSVYTGYNDFLILDKIPNLMINDFNMFELGV